MALTGEDLQKLIDDVEEARQLIAAKAALEQDIALAEKRLAKVNSELNASREQLSKLDKDLIAARARYEHERTRFSLDLTTHKQQCDEAKKVESERVTAEKAQLKADHDAHMTTATAEKRALAQELGSMRGVRSQLQAEATDFKRRIQTLLG